MKIKKHATKIKMFNKTSLTKFFKQLKKLNLEFYTKLKMSSSSSPIHSPYSCHVTDFLPLSNQNL